MIRKSQNSTQSVEPVIETREQIYRLALENFKRLFPQYDSVSMIASRLGIGAKMLYAILEGNRHFTVAQQDSLFRECQFSAGYDLLKQINFHE